MKSLHIITVKANKQYKFLTTKCQVLPSRARLKLSLTARIGMTFSLVNYFSVFLEARKKSARDKTKVLLLQGYHRTQILLGS